MVIPINLQIAELEAMLQDEEANQEAILLARKYYQGEQVVYLTARAMEFLGIHENNTFRVNICRTIVDSLAAELNLLGFDTSEEGETKTVSDWVSEIYDRNKLDSLQDTVHESALSDSETFILVDWDSLEQYPRFIHHVRLVDTGVTLENGLGSGDGDGIFFLYENDDPNQRPRAAVKQWIETEFIGPTALPQSTIRRTIYYSDHIERWVYDNGTWNHFGGEEISETGEVIREWWIPWLAPDGSPLGIPVFHFKNKGLRPEHWDAIPLQDAANKQLVDALAAGDLTAFQSFFGFGFYPTVDGKEPKSDGSNLMKMGPAQFNGTLKTSDQAALQVIQGADVTPLYNALKDIVTLAAQITETPVSRFVISAQVASEKTIKEQDRQLKKKAADRRGLFGDPWVGAFDMARKLANLYGNAGLSEDVALSPIWENTDTLQDLAEKKTALGIPVEQLWREAGYTDEQIEGMRKDPSYRVEFERALWEGANIATQNIPLELYLKRAGLPAEEIEEILNGIQSDENIPSTDL